MRIAKRAVWFLGAVLVCTLAAGYAQAAELKIGIMQASAGEARTFQPLLDYFAKKGVTASFVTAQDYPAAADMFAKGTVSAMFSGSGVAGTMIIKGVADPLVRPVQASGVSTYSAVVIAPKGSAKFSGNAGYFDGKRVIFSSLASSGEFYFHSLGPSKPAALLKAASHGAAIDALSRGQADVAIVKNHVWSKEKGKYGSLELVGGDEGENPDNTLIVSKKLDAATAQKVAGILLGLKNDASAEAAAVKDSLKIQGFMTTTNAASNIEQGLSGPGTGRSSVSLVRRGESCRSSSGPSPRCSSRSRF
jgi:ABC-type phosphate/phosphonate transport system substrate-binding protein